MRTALSIALVVAVLSVLASPVATAHAQAPTTDDERAHAHFASGTAYFSEARYEDAAREFEEAFALSARPELLENVARSYERALRFDDAIHAIERLRVLWPDSATSLTQRIAALEQLRDRVQVRDDDDEEEGDDGDDDDDHDDDASDDAGEDGVAAPPPSGYVSAPGLATLIAGGVLGLVAIGTGVGSLVLYDDVRSACTDGVCPASRRADADTGNALALTSTVLAFVAPVAIGVGILLLVLDTGPSQASAEHARLEWTAGPGELGLGARVRF